MAVSYDVNGNMLDSGVSTYAWNVRDQLATVTGPVNASFQYDPFGRRSRRSEGSLVTTWLYDGLNFVQETEGVGNVTAVSITVGVDELLAKLTGTTTVVRLADQVGSTVAETDGSQNTVNTTSYEPYGLTTQIGTASTNRQQVTGREQDETGLYYFRARYYDPKMGRFISEDPAGVADGLNLYAYASGNPVNLRSHGFLKCLT